MNYELNEDQRIIKESAHRLLAEACPSDFVRRMAQDEKGFTAELWNSMAELGWMGLPFPEEYGGSGMSFLDLAVILTEMGYFCTPGPFFSTVVLGGLTVLEVGSEEQKRAILPEVAAGKRFLTLAWLEEEGVFQPQAIRLTADLQADQYLLSGTKLFVPDAHVADTILCAARTGKPPKAISLFLVDAKQPGIRITPLHTVADDKQFEVAFDRVPVPESGILGKAGKGWPVLHNTLLRAAVGKCAEMDGASRKALEFAVGYAKERVQFGKLIGTFQAIQQHCADMLTLADTIHFMTCHAAWKIAAGPPFDQEASMCKAWVSQNHRKLVALAHQVLGGIGFMEEHDLQIYFRRAKAAELAFGDADLHRERVAQAMGL
jgi:alkylation response protein AidB-like acyl-CoA dehydrogenase